MARRNEVSTERLCLREKCVKFDELVAANTGVGCSTAAVLLNEIVDDVAAERVAEVDDVVRDVERGADATGILDRAERATRVLALDDRHVLSLGPDVQCDAN